MLIKLLDLIAGKEPVATATGLAGLVTAFLGVAAAFGADITAEQIAAIGVLAAALAGWAARRVVSPVMTPGERQLNRALDREAALTVGRIADAEQEAERGGIPLAAVILLAVLVFVMVGFLATCDALFDDEDEDNDLGSMPARALNHERDRCYDDGDCGGGEGDEYGDGRGGYSGGPSGGYYEGGKGGSDYDGDGDGNRCRNFCFYGVPAPGEGGQR
jgi:hypothetical protein